LHFITVGNGFRRLPNKKNSGSTLPSPDAWLKRVNWINDPSSAIGMVKLAPSMVFSHNKMTAKFFFGKLFSLCFDGG
tara:strand:+ start:213 stop:443 length:231 start_codon:yes stop_codon:yes gene_type:complete